jgi:transposase InsO family protein
MAEEDQDKTAFRCPFGTFAFKVMPLGLKNASKTFQRMVEYVLRDFIGKSVIVFIDDILVYSNTKEEHEITLRNVLKTMKENELYLKTKKCEFFRKEVTFLGHVISHNKVSMDPKKIQIVREWGQLETKKDVQRFLGFTNFYRRFIRNFAKIANPLNKLLVNTPDKAKITMNEEAQKAQQELIEAVTCGPTLTMFDSSKELKVVTDASKEGMGAILMQREDEKIWKTVEFQSRALDGDRTKQTGEYSLAPRDLELCAISYALDKFRQYLAGNKFTVASDHKSLSRLETSKINSGRLARILEQLAEFDFRIEYNEGTSAIITVADALSRLPKHRKVAEEIEEKEKSRTEKHEHECELFEILGLEEETTEKKQWGTAILETDKKLLQEIKNALLEDTTFKDIITILQRTEKEKDYKPPKDMAFKVSNYRWDNDEGLLYRILANKEKLCIPDKGVLRINRILEAHDIPLGGHFGREKTLANLANNFFWPGITTDVEDFVKSCINCQRNKAVRRAPIGLLYPHDRPQARWEQIALDFIVQLPTTRTGKYNAILTVVDFFSRRSHFIPCHANITAIGTAQLLREHVIKIHGYPKRIVSDRGSIFTSEIWKELFRCLKAKQNLSSSYHPQTDGITEKENDIIENCIRAFTNYQQDDWNEYLPDFELAINAAISDSTGLSPYFLDTGYEPFLPLSITREVENKPTDKTARDLIEKLDFIKTKTQILFAQAQEKQAKYANEKRRDIEFQEGDYVMLNSDFVYDPIHTDRPSRKLANKWLGPFRIMKKISRVAYKLFIPKEDNIKVHPVIHIANLKQFNENPERFQQREDFIVPQPIKDSEQESVYLVDDILDMRLFKRKKQFLIKWTGYDDPTWEDESTLRASPEFNQHIDVYEEQLRNGQLVQMKHMSNKRNAKAN